MAAPDWTTACPDWERRIVAGRSLIPFKPLFPSEAEAALRIFKGLILADVAGKPAMGDVSRAWVLDLVAAIFGAYDPETGRRLIQAFLLAISKKNTKSTTAAGISLTALMLNWRASNEFLLLAPTLEVANNNFFPARDMIREDPELAEILHVQEHIKTITHRVTRALLKVVAADNDTVSGKKAAGVVVDELWLFGKRAGAENMLREATGGLASRPEGFVVYLTTQSDAPPAGVFKQKLNYFRDVRDGKILDKRSLPVIYEFPKALLDRKAYLEPRYWSLTNPNLGLSVDEEWLARELAEAQTGDEGSLRVFLAKHLNVEIGQSLRGDRWPGADFWQAQADPTLTLKTLLERSEVATIGIDGGGLDDLFGIVVLGRELGTRRWLAWGHCFAHLSVLRRRKAIASVLIDFARAGELTVFDASGPLPWEALSGLVDAPELRTPADAALSGEEPPTPPDIAGVVEICVEVDHASLLAAVGIDPAGVGAVIDALAKVSIADDPGDGTGRVRGVSQGYKLMGAIKTAERKLADGTLVHAGQAIAAWCVGNAKTEVKGNATMITKQASGVAKIDWLMALFDAVALMSTNPEAEGSIWDRPDLAAAIGADRRAEKDR